MALVCYIFVRTPLGSEQRRFTREWRGPGMWVSAACLSARLSAACAFACVPIGGQKRYESVALQILRVVMRMQVGLVHSGETEAG